MALLGDTAFNLEKYPYIYQRHPVNTKPERFLTEPHEGGNCELVTHAVTMARGFELPRVRSSELFADTIYTKAVDDVSKAKTGDIIGLCKKDKVDYRGIHMGILWLPTDKETYLVHNARHEGHVKLQTLEEAMHYGEHAKIAWIKRPIKNNPSKSNPQALRELGLEYLTR